jgi:hypothetical protein
MSFRSRRFAGRSHDHTIGAQTRSSLMNQHASKAGVRPSVGADVSGLATLLNRNVPDVFCEGDPARRRAANSGTLHRRLCAIRAARHVRWSRRTGQVRWRFTSDGSPFCLYAAWRTLGFCTTRWGSGPRGETPAYTGVDFIIVRDGKIAALYMSTLTRP